MRASLTTFIVTAWTNPLVVSPGNFEPQIGNPL